MIEFKNVFKCYKEGKNAVDNLNLVVNDGEIFGFLGPNGAGKTTTIKMLTGILKSSRGEILINGKNEATYIKTLPINFKKQFYAKTSSGIILGFAGLTISILFAYKILELKLIDVCILIVLGSLLNILQAYLHLLIDLIHPKLYWDTEVAVVKQNINIFYSIIVSFILILITFFLGNILSGFSLIYFVLGYLIIIISALVILKIIINRYSEKLYDKIN